MAMLCLTTVGIGPLLPVSMEDELESMLRKFKLTDEEQISAEIIKVNDKTSGRDEFSLFCKVLTSKAYNKNAFRSTSKMILNMVKGFEIKLLGENLFLV